MKFKIGIIGGSGYVAGELIRTLIHHPLVVLKSIVSSNYSGQLVSSIHQDLIGQTDLKFDEEISQNIDVLFLCLGHGVSYQIINEMKLQSYTKIIDLSNDFRLKNNQLIGKRKFTYGLVELNKVEVKSAKNIANPGCFATAIQLAILPLAKEQWLTKEIHIHAITGSTGAGQEKIDTTHFSWRANNVSVYKPFEHQHLNEINESIAQLQPFYQKDINFIPMRGNFARGIFASCYTEIGSLSLEVIKNAYKEFYKDSDFVKISETEVHLKQVVGTNNCLIHLSKHGKKLLITSVIDNLLKGAAGQAIENMNLMLGIPQKLSLELKANYF